MNLLPQAISPMSHLQALAQVLAQAPQNILITRVSPHPTIHHLALAVTDVLPLPLHLQGLLNLLGQVQMG